MEETDENTTNPQQVPPTPQASHSILTIKLHILKKEGLHKGYDRFQRLLSQLETHGVGVFTEDANQKFHSGPQLDQEDIEQVDEFDLKEMDLKWQSALIATIHDTLLESADQKEIKIVEGEMHETLDTKQGTMERDLQNRMNIKLWSLLMEKAQTLRSNDVEDSLVNDRFAKVEGMHASITSESDAKTSDLDSCESSSSEEILETMPKPVESKPKVFNTPKVWTDAPMIKEPFNRTTTPKVNFTQHKVNTARDKSVSAVGGKWETAVKDSASWNKAYLVDYQDFNGGLVAFGGSKGHIIGKDTECLVLSPNFKLPDENQILLRVPSQHNMYSFNLENIVPSGGLAYLIAKAIFDESNKWQKTLGKFVEKSDEGFLVGYSLSSKAFRNKANKTTGPKETDNSAGTQDSFDARNSKIEADHALEYYVLPLWSSYTSTIKSSKAKNGDEKLNEDTDSKTNEEPVDQEDQAFLEELERLKRQEKEANDAAETLRKMFAQNESWVDAMQEELLQFKIQKVWILVDFPFGKKAIRTKWVYRNKKDKRGVVVRNKARLVTQGHRQEEGIDYDENDKKDIMLVQVYVDDIIFGSTKKSWCDEFETLMKNKFQMSSMGQLAFFLRLQVKQKADGIFISHDKYVAEILKKFSFLSVKTASTPIKTKKPLVKDEAAADVDVHLYRSMISSLMYLTASRHDIMRLISWQCKKQTIIATSTIEA
nr:hypothetical protein [Tanacetum cinerariifolium]